MITRLQRYELIDQFRALANAVDEKLNSLTEAQINELWDLKDKAFKITDRRKNVRS